MSYNPYPPQGYNPPPIHQSHPLPPNPNQTQNQGYPPAPPSNYPPLNNYDRPPPPGMSSGPPPVPYGGPPAPYGGPPAPYGRDERGSSGPAPRYGGGGGDRREMSPGRRNYPQQQEDRRPSGGGRDRDRGFSREHDRDRDRGSGSGSGPSRGPPRKDPRSNAERIDMERPNRILFVRNISFEAESDRLKLDFEQHGEIQSWFDMIKRRGMVFVTYYDLRAAQRAKEALHGIKIGTREIDVHYGLPKEEDMKGKCDKDKNQGSILIILKPHVPINIQECGRMCDSFGAVKSLRGCNSASQAIVEYWDSRGAVELFENMNGKPFEGGTLDMKYIWDEPPPGHSKPERREGSRGRRVSEQRGPPGGGYDRDREYNQGPPRDRYSDHPPAPAVDDRLDQARKVQQLLANLGNVPPQSNGYPPYPPPNERPPAPGYGPPPNERPPAPGYGPPPSNNYAPPHPAPAPYPNSNSGYGNLPARPPPSNYNAPPPAAAPYAPPSSGYAPPPSNYPPPVGGGYNPNPNPNPSPAPGYGGPPPPNPTYGNNNNNQPPPAFNPNPNPPYNPPPNNGYNPPPAGYTPAPQGYPQPPPSPYDPAAQGQGYRPNVPIAADPRRPPPQGQGQGQYRPPPQAQGQGSEVGNLLARLNQNR